MVLFMPVDVDLDGVELSKTQLLNNDNSVQQIKEVKKPKASKKNLKIRKSPNLSSATIFLKSILAIAFLYAIMALSIKNHP